MVYSAVALRDLLALVEGGLTDQRDALFQVEDALFQHSKSNKKR